MADEVSSGELPTAGPRASRGLGESLVAVLGGPPQPVVLSIGDGARKWSSLFPDACHVASLEGLGSPRIRPDLVVYEPSGVSTRLRLRAELRSIGSMLKPSGRVIVLSRNPFVLRGWRHVLWRLGVLRRGVVSSRSWKKLLSSLDFQDIQGFAAVGGAATPGTLVSIEPDSSLPLPPQPGLPRWIRRAGLHRLIAADGVLVAGEQPLVESALMRRVGSMCREGGAIESVERVERLDLRQRGALVAVISGRDGRRWVTRVISDESVDSVVSRNAAFLTFLRQAEALPADLLSRLPIPMGRFEYREATVYVESFIAGTLAWKVHSHGLEDRIRHDTEAFICELQNATRRAVRFDREIVEGLFRDGLLRLEQMSVSPPLTGFVEAGIEVIASRLAGEDGALVAAHGDYGYGNILVDPDSGSLHGVIDWDTGRREELPAIDFLNHRVQRERIVGGVGIFQAFRAVARSLERDEEVLGEHDVFAEYDVVNLDRAVLRETVLLATHLRYLFRAAQYPEVFAAQQQEFVRTFALFPAVESQAPISGDRA